MDGWQEPIYFKLSVLRKQAGGNQNVMKETTCDQHAVDRHHGFSVLAGMTAGGGKTFHGCGRGTVVYERCPVGVGK